MTIGTLEQFWHGRRVLLTGHTGFKGAWLSVWLAGLGAEVTGYALAPSGGQYRRRRLTRRRGCHVGRDRPHALPCKFFLVARRLGLR